MAIADRLGDFPSTLDATRYHQNIANVWQLRKSNQYHCFAPLSHVTGFRYSCVPCRGRRILGTSRSDKALA